MPIQTPQWTEFLTCPICYNEFEERVRRPISLGCGHTMCKACLSQLHKTQCPFDQATVNMDIENLPVNTALLQLVGAVVTDDTLSDIPSISENVGKYREAMTGIEELALYLKPLSSMASGSIASSNGTNSLPGTTPLTRPMQRKLVTLVNCQLAEEEGRTRAMRAARSLGERTVTELILLHQNPQQLSANLWAAVRNRGCQFLGPAMQEEALKLILLALEGGESLSRKVLVLFVVQRLEPVYPQASKTSIGHVVQLLYRASCFKVTKRDDDSSLMQLKEQFRTYDSLRKEHDAQIVQIAMEAGLRISPDQWSSLLYGELEKKSHMQSIIDKLQSPSSFSQSIQELIISLQRSNDPGELSRLRTHFELLSEIDTTPEAHPPTWDELAKAMCSVHAVVKGLVSFSKMYGSKMKGSTDPPQPNHNFSRFKTSMCRDYQKLSGCPRGANCSFAHSEEELENSSRYGGRGQRRPKPKAPVVARGPSAGPDQYLPMENGSSDPSPQSSHMNGDSARSSPLCVSGGAQDMSQSGYTQPQYRRPSQEPLTQRMKQMSIQPQVYPHEGNYGATGPHYDRVPYSAAGDRGNYYNGYYGQSPPVTIAPPGPSASYGVVARGDMKGPSVPPPGVLTPRSSPLTIQEDTMNGSRDSGMSNGHTDAIPVRRSSSRIPFDPLQRRRRDIPPPGYQYDHGYAGYVDPPYYSAGQSSDYYAAPYSSRVAGTFEPVSPGVMSYVPTCRRDVSQYDYYPAHYPPPGLYDGRTEVFHGDGMMGGTVLNGINGRYCRENGLIQRRSPYIPDAETSDSPQSDFGDREELPDRNFVDEWLRDLKNIPRKDTTFSNTSSGVSSSSPLSHSPAASQSSSSSLSPRQESPIGWQRSDSDKIWQNYFSENGSLQPPPGISDATPIWTLHKQREVRKLWLPERIAQISKDEKLARELQEAENSSGSDFEVQTTNDMAIVEAIQQMDKEEEEAAVRHNREQEEQERSKARMEQEENDCRIAIETQALEEGNEVERRKKLEHERLYLERRKLLQKQSKETQELSDCRLAHQIAFEDAKKAGLVDTRQIIKPIGYNPNIIMRGPSSTCPLHGNGSDIASRRSSFSAFNVGGYRNGCGPTFAGDDDVIDASRINPGCNGDIFVQE